MDFELNLINTSTNGLEIRLPLVNKKLAGNISNSVVVRNSNDLPGSTFF